MKALLCGVLAVAALVLGFASPTAEPVPFSGSIEPRYLPKGDRGDPGAPGLKAPQRHYGNGNPTLAAPDGEFYIDQDTRDIWTRRGGVWINLFAAVKPPASTPLATYGAACDGQTDDSQEIAAAFADAGTAWTVLDFPTGATCIIANPIAITGKSGFEVRGNGATVKAANGMAVASDQFVLHFNGSSNFQVRNLTIDGNRANRTPAETSAHNIYLSDAHSFLFENVRSINAASDGISVRGRTNAEADPAHFSTDGRFTRVTVLNAFRLGMHIKNAARIVIEDSTFSDTNGTWPQAGVDIEPNDGTAIPGVVDVVIRRSQFVNNRGLGVQLSRKGAPTGILVEQNYFADNNRGGTIIATTNTTIKDNYFVDHLVGTGVPCPDNTCFRSVVETPSGSGTGSLIEGNSIVNAAPDTAGIFLHSVAPPSRVRNNCLKNVTPTAITNSNGSTLDGNAIDPAGGCPIPAGVPVP